MPGRKSKFAKDANWLIDRLESQRRLFDETERALTVHQQALFLPYCCLLRENEASLAGGSRQRKSVRLRARNILKDIFLSLGIDVFVLCTLATTITALSTVLTDELVPKLLIWWDDAQHPTGLAETAKKLCSDNRIDELFSSTQQLAIGAIRGNNGKDGAEDRELSAAVSEDALSERSEDDAAVTDHETSREMEEGIPVTQPARITGPLGGRTFQLTTADVQKILTTSDVVGQPWLTDPYNSTLPFITFQISQELGRLLGMQLPHEDF